MDSFVPPIASAQLDVALIDNELLQILFEPIFQYLPTWKKNRTYVTAVLKTLSFLFSVGMGYPTPAMLAYNIHLKSKTSGKHKKRVLSWLFYSTILPCLWQHLVHTTQRQEHDNNSNEEGTNIASQTQRQAVRRRHLILSNLVATFTRILPIIQLLHFLHFLYTTTKLTSNIKLLKQSSETFSLPPTLAMKIAGLRYVTTAANQTNYRYKYNITYSQQRMMWQHIQHFILQLGGEAIISRIMLFSDRGAALPVSLSWKRRLTRQWYQLRNTVASSLWWPSFSTLMSGTAKAAKRLQDEHDLTNEDEESLKQEQGASHPTITSYSTTHYCPICLSRNIRNPYETLPCRHIHCYVCLCMSAMKHSSQTCPDHPPNINFCCLQCGTKILSSRRI